MHKLIIWTKVICNFTQYSHDGILHKVIKLKWKMKVLFYETFYDSVSHFTHTIQVLRKIMIVYVLS